MINTILSEAKNQVKKSQSFKEYKQVLKSTTERLELAVNTQQSSIQDPVAAIVIEVYMECPEAVYEYAQENKLISNICSSMFSFSPVFSMA